MNGVIGGVAAGESFRPVDMPSITASSVNNNPEHRVEIVDGDFID